MKSSPSSVFFVTSHLEEHLTKFYGLDGVIPINLNNLSIPHEFSSQLLAESRFFLSDHLDQRTEDFIGLGTPRWSERFPKWPDIKATNEFSVQLKSNEFLSPQSLYSKSENVNNWIIAQDIVHPGISEILVPIWQELNQHKKGSICWLPMGNSFVFPRDTFLEVTTIWREIFTRYSLSEFQNLPFTYRCVKCGLISDEGIGRWKSNRHASYFLERVMALIVASRQNLIAVRINSKGNRIRKSISNTTFGLPSTAKIYTSASSKLMNSRNCNHLHFGPGKR